jgi:hypothetical protein
VEGLYRRPRAGESRRGGALQPAHGQGRGSATLGHREIERRSAAPGATEETGALLLWDVAGGSGEAAAWHGKGRQWSSS